MKLFISYSRKDVTFARRLATDLEAQGASVWFDQDNIPAGKKWSTAVQEALDSCEIMIVIISPDSMASTNVEDEWQYYLDERKPVIPVQLRPAKVHFQLKRIQYIDFHEQHYDQAIGQLLAELQQRILQPISAPDNPSALAESTAAPGTIRTDSKGIKQVWVPPGQFLMGSDPTVDEHAQPNEQPQHEVHISRGFWLDMYPVTNAAYQQFIDDDGYKQQAFWSADGWKWLQESRVIGPEYYKNFIDGQKPCVGISWYEADAYARWRGGRLPTEAEWEYAARGPQSNIYPWGNFWDERRANTSDGGPGTTTPVTHYENGKSWCGAYDLAGNVWEWASDWYDRGYYQRLIANDPQGPTSGDYLVVRGGSWLNLPITARGAARSRYNADFRYHDVGARVVLDAEST